jgi:hypothetical protein
MEAMHRFHVIHQKSEMKAVGVSVCVRFLSLKDQDKPVVVAQKSDGRRPSVRLKLKSKRFFEERDRPWGRQRPEDRDD